MSIRDAAQCVGHGGGGSGTVAGRLRVSPMKSGSLISPITGKESGGYLYIYDGAQLAANPAGAKPTTTIDLSREINTFCEEATRKPVRRPHMLFFNQQQDHVILSFLSGHVLFMDAATKKTEACVSMGKNVHAAWSTPDQKMAIAANITEKTFIRIWTDYTAHTSASILPRTS